MALFNYECDEVKRIIDEVSPNYPQLTTYEKEWLFFHKYHYIPGIPVELECETVNVNPNASVFNAIPFKYKSAILSGRTLVNLATLNSVTYSGNTTIAKRYILNETYFKQNTDYLLLYKSNIETTNVGFQTYASGNGFVSLIIPSLQKEGIVKFNSGNAIGVRISSNNDFSETITISDIMLIEYQEGMENWDIPFFEGMQSVKMPVLTTTGKNLWNPKKMFVYENLSNEIYSKQTLDFLQIGKKYVIKAIKTDKCQDRKVWIKYDGENVNGYYVISEGQPATPLPNGFIYTGVETLGIYSEGISKEDMCSILHDEYNFFIYESGTHSDVYEPHKSNILTVNEEVELRGIGDVQDTLDLLTGEVIENFESFTFNGSEDWKLQDDSLENTTRFILLNYAPNKVNNQKIGITNTYEWGIFDADKPGIVITNPSGHVYLRTSKMSVDELKTMLSNNPIHGYYNKEKSIKTVDLTPLNKPYEGTNHYELTSNIPCEAILEVPVVSTGKQTLEEINN